MNYDDRARIRENAANIATLRAEFNTWRDRAALLERRMSEAEPAIQAAAARRDTYGDALNDHERAIAELRLVIADEIRTAIDEMRKTEQRILDTLDGLTSP